MTASAQPLLYGLDTPDKPALVMGNGEVVTFRDFDRRSNQVAHMLREMGLRKGSVIALAMDNNPYFNIIAHGAQRSGLIYVPISTRLLDEEIAYIVRDSGARVLFATVGPGAAKLPRLPTSLERLISISGDMDGYGRLESLITNFPVTPVDDEAPGNFMIYSSGTTGRPKGIHMVLETSRNDSIHPMMQKLGTLFALDSDSVYLCPAPLYHSAPLMWTMRVLRGGGTCVIMEKFDPETALMLIEKYRITHGQFVPTMFVRLLKLPESVRERYDIGSLKVAVHAAAPCPVDAKQAMIKWWGPIISEYYGASEGLGGTALSASEWLSHPGSVGRPVFGTVHITDDLGDELPTGEHGTIWFENGGKFEYFNDPQKTLESTNERGWRTVGDIGRLDEDGYLYLTDRKANLIISGGVNIYPQETENLLLMHPKVLDAAVFGVPNEEMGEEVKAVVQLVDPSDANGLLADELIAYCQAHLSRIKCPRSIDFATELPRHPNGKLYKRKLRDLYWRN